MLKGFLVSVACVMLGGSVLMLPYLRLNCSTTESRPRNFEFCIENPAAMKIMTLINIVEGFISDELGKLGRLIERIQRRVETPVVVKAGVVAPRRPDEPIFLPLQLAFFTTVFLYRLLSGRKYMRKKVRNKRKPVKTRQGKRGKYRRRQKKERKKMRQLVNVRF